MTGFKRGFCSAVSLFAVDGLFKSQERRRRSRDRVVAFIGIYIN